MRALTRAVPAALLVAMLALPAAASADDGKPDYDSRGNNRLPAFSSTERGSQADLARDVGEATGDGRIEANRSGVSVSGLGDPLTGPSGGDGVAIAESYLREHAAALGLTAADIAGLRVKDRYTDWSGVTHVVWTQTAGGLDAYDNEVRANIARDGSLINVGSTAIPEFGSAGAPDLSAGEALGVASRNVDATGPAPRPGAASGRDRETRFSNGASAKLTLFGEPGGARLAWRVSVAGEDPNVYDVIVDAGSGNVLLRHNIVDYANAQVWERSPGAPGDDPHVVDLTAPGYLTDTSNGWIAGPNARAWSDTTDDCKVLTFTTVSNPGCNGPVGADETVPPSSADPHFVYPLTPFTGLNAIFNCPALGCTWDPTDATTQANSWKVNRLQNVVQAFYYVNQFHDHLLAPPIGFDKASKNFEAGGPGGNDPVLVNADDGATAQATHVNNANFATPTDGVTPVMQMYLFVPTGGSPQFRAVNGGDDGIVVYHEYTHGLSNRLLANGVGINGNQPAAMGEAWSDWYAFDYQVASGRFTDTSAPGEMDADAYVTQTGGHVIRTQALDCPVGADAAICPGQRGAGPGGYTYGDFGKVVFGVEEHADGEIWGETLWDLRTAIGSAAAERIITDAMRISPTAAPTFTQQRDSIIAADLNAFNGSHLDQIWKVFATRGMGWKATSPGSNSTTASEDFSLPSLLAHTTTTVDDAAPGGDGDLIAEPGETVKLTEQLTNTAGRQLTGTAATLSSANGVVDDDNSSSALNPATVANAGTASNASPFVVTIPDTNECGARVPLQMGLSSDQGTGSIAFDLGTGTATGTPIDTSRTESPALAIPDGTKVTVDSSMAVAGAGRVGDVDLKLDQLDSQRASDVKAELIAPSGRVVTLINRVPSVGAAGTNFTNTVLDDDTAGGTIGAAGSAPWTGTFKPQAGYGKLSDFDGEPIAGTWRLRLLDGGVSMVSSLTTWSLHITPAGCSTSAPALPGAETLAATGVGLDAATLAGNVDPKGTSTQFRFDYGTTTGYGQRTAVADAGAGSGAVPVSQAIGGLSSATTYHYRVATLRNGVVVARGADQAFATPAPKVASPGITPPTNNPPVKPPLSAGFSFTKSPKTLTLDKKGQFTWSFAALAGLKGKATFKSVAKLPLRVEITTAAKKKKIITLGSKSFTVTSKGAGKVKVTLAKKVFSYIKKHKSIKVSVSVASTSPKGTAKTIFTLKAPKAKKKK